MNPAGSSTYIRTHSRMSPAVFERLDHRTDRSKLPELTKQRRKVLDTTSDIQSLEGISFSPNSAYRLIFPVLGGEENQTYHFSVLSEILQAYKKCINAKYIVRSYRCCKILLEVHFFPKAPVLPSVSSSPLIDHHFARTSLKILGLQR